MVLFEDEIIFCDAKNHKIKSANLKTRQVKTIAGSGRCVWVGSVPEDGWDILDADITSPWDIVHYKDKLFFIAVSGTH